MTMSRLVVFFSFSFCLGLRLRRLGVTEKAFSFLGCV